MDYVLTKPFTEQQLETVIARFLPAGVQRAGGPTGVAATRPCGTDSKGAEKFSPHHSEPIGDESKLAELSQQIGEDTLDTLLAACEKSLEERIVKLRAGLDGSDSDAIFEAAHSMKGASGSMFGVRMSALAAVVEENSQDLDATRDLLPEVEKTAGETISWWRSKRIASWTPYDAGIKIPEPVFKLDVCLGLRFRGCPGIGAITAKSN